MIKLFFLVDSEFKYNLFFKEYITENIKQNFIFYLVVDYSQKLLFTSEHNLNNIIFCNIKNITTDLNNINPEILIIDNFDEEYIKKLNIQNIQNIICEKNNLQNDNIYFFEKKSEIIKKILIILKNVYKYEIIEKYIPIIKNTKKIKKNIPNIFIQKIKNKINNNKNIDGNAFEINLNFISLITGYKTKEDILYYIYINNLNTVLHPKQLFNLFQNNIEIKNNYIYYKNITYEIKDFVQIINNFSYEKFKELTFQKIKEKNVKKEDNLIILFIGDLTIGKYILDRIQKYKLIENFNLAICCKYNLVKEVKIYDFDILYSSNEFGNDIVPSLLVWDDLKDKNYNNIIKIHTKSNINILNKSLDFLLNNNINEIKLLKNNESSCIGYKYINMENDIFNKNLINENKELINNNYFVPYTIFLTEENIMNKVLTFFKNNNKIIFLQNMYDTNMINRDYSYVHFMERLFGYS
jgi:hypothetical protein